MDVGVRELKMHLSEYVGRAAAGENIVVTDRGRPRAMIVPVPDEQSWDRGIAEGWITPPSQAGPPPSAPRRVRTDATIQEMLDDDRGE